MSRRSWTVREVKIRFSEIINAARREPQTVTKRGKPVAVVVGIAEYERLQRRDRARVPSFAQMLLAMPQDDGDFSGKRGLRR